MPVSSTNTAIGCRSSISAAISDASVIRSRLRNVRHGKTALPCRTSRMLRSSPYRAMSTPMMTGAYMYSASGTCFPMAASTSGRPRSLSAATEGNWPRMLTFVQSWSRPQSAICSRAHFSLMRGDRRGSSGSPVIVMVFQRFAFLTRQSYSAPSTRVGFPMSAIRFTLPVASDASAADTTPGGMSPASSTRTMVWSACSPARVFACWVLSACFGHVRAEMYQSA